MVPEMTPAVERALAAAREWASRLGEAEVGPAHLLAGLLEEEEGRATALLQAAGVDVPALRRALAAGAAAEAPPAATPLPLAAATHQVLAQAGDVAASLFVD